MNIINKFKNFLSDPETDEFDEVDDEMDFVSKSEEKSQNQIDNKKGNKVVNIHTQLQVVLVKPSGLTTRALLPTISTPSVRSF